MATLEAFEDAKEEDQNSQSFTDSPPSSAASRSSVSSSPQPPPTEDLPKLESDHLSDDDDGERARFSPEEEASLLAESDAIRQQGNAIFGDHDYDAAREKYEKALAICPKYLDQPRSVLWSNISACHAKQEKWQDTVDACTQALKLQPHYMKPLVRRAQANEKIESWSSLQSAVDDYKLAGDISPTSNQTFTLAIARLQPKIADAQKRETAEMLTKLKELGNGILRPFGLNTDMFKMQPDGKGGYSMSFSK
ncbi:hypothetical protein V1525DRAFT_365460 [Lipomyces kononenkoae]|uniref:Uncharacterized protein n=1 Tax=Lipomyces kononenkoae TaxID=34357 RepID=A0ACC3SWS0_LIPKO